MGNEQVFSHCEVIPLTPINKIPPLRQEHLQQRQVQGLDIIWPTVMTYVVMKVKKGPKITFDFSIIRSSLALCLNDEIHVIMVEAVDRMMLFSSQALTLIRLYST